MPDKYPLMLRQADQARADFAAISNDLDFIKAQLARIPRRKELAHFVLLGTLTTAALVLCGIEVLFR